LAAERRDDDRQTSHQMVADSVAAAVSSVIERFAADRFDMRVPSHRQSQFHSDAGDDASSTQFTKSSARGRERLSVDASQLSAAESSRSDRSSVQASDQSGRSSAQASDHYSEDFDELSITSSRKNANVKVSQPNRPPAS